MSQLKIPRYIIMNKFNTNSLIKLPILFLATGICMCSPQKGDNTVEIAQWTSYFSSSSSSTEFIMSVIADKSGNIYAGGVCENYVNAASYYDYKIKKFNANGDEITSWFGGNYS